MRNGPPALSTLICSVPYKDHILVATKKQGYKKLMENQMRVLLVEDDPGVAAGIEALLGEEGHEVCVIHLGGDAEVAAESFRPDVVLLDVRLPDVDGSEVFRRLRQRWSDLAVVFSSGHVNSLRELGAEESDKVAILRKPYDAATLFRALAEVGIARS